MPRLNNPARLRSNLGYRGAPSLDWLSAVCPRQGVGRRTALESNSGGPSAELRGSYVFEARI